MIYVKSELNPTDRCDFENSTFKECKWVDIHVGNEKKTLISVCYRAPLTSAQEDEGLIELNLKASNEITLVMGDFNFPGIKLESNKASGNEEEFLECNELRSRSSLSMSCFLQGVIIYWIGFGYV